MTRHRLNDQLKNRLTLAGAVVVGSIVRLIGLGKASIWHDEGYSLMLAPHGPAEILARTARDVHPPLYYLALHYWLKLFGTSEATARSLSLIFSVLTIVVIFFIVKKLFGDRPARLTAWFSALAPFLVRYAQEARMYAMVAFLLALATWLLIKAVERNRISDWAAYGLVMALAFYTHYYAVFMVAVHLVYLATQPRANLKRLLPGFLTGSGVMIILFLPWVPTAYAQFSRVQAAFWIPKVTINTMPSTLAQFQTFTDLGRIPLLRWAGAVGFILTLISAWSYAKTKRRQLLLLVAYAWLAPLAVFILSFKRPIYVDRYFVFAAVGFFALLAVLAYLAWPWRKYAWARQILIAVNLMTFVIGLRNVYAQSNHQMRQVGAEVSDRFKPGDEVISGELYTYFDFSFYNGTGQTLKLLAPNGVNGYGETSLLYDRADQIVVRDLADLKPASGYVWVIGKTGRHDYFDRVPANWVPVGPRFSSGYVASQKYYLDN